MTESSNVSQHIHDAPCRTPDNVLPNLCNLNRRPHTTYPNHHDPFVNHVPHPEFPPVHFNQLHDHVDENTMKVEGDALEFDGCLDLEAFLDWVDVIEDYFDQYQMPNYQRLRFTKMKLVKSAKHYWQAIIRTLERLG